MKCAKGLAVNTFYGAAEKPKKKMRKGKSLNFERLENRRLLAADLGYDIAECCMCQPADECMVAPDIVESDAPEIFVDPIAPDEGAAQDSISVDPAATLDLSDGMDGYYGSLDAENQSDTMQFTASADGVVDVVVASSFGENTTNLHVTDANGDLVAASDTEGLDGFQTLSFAVDADQAYQLTVSSEDGGQGNFQVTVGIEFDSAIVDDGPATPETDVTDDVVEDSDDCLSEDEETETENDDTSVDDTNTTDDHEHDHDHDTDDTDSGPEGDGEFVSTDGETVSEEDQDDINPDPTDAGPEAESNDDTTDDNCEDLAPTDLHVNEIGPDATLLEFVDGSAGITGELESVNDSDVFRFTAPQDGEIVLFAGETSDQNVDIDINIHDEAGNLIVDGATNEAVQVSFSVEENCEYYISIESGDEQTGTYELLAEITPDASEPAIVDDHANEIGENATIVEVADGVGNATGELETGADTDAFRVIANADGEIVLDLQVDSQDHQADAQVSIFQGEQLIADGTTNETVGLRFDTAANVEYQVLVDSLNDVPMNYELVANEIPSVIDVGDDDQLVTDQGPQDEVTDDELDSELEICTFENETTDEVFSEIGETEFAASDLDDTSSNSENPFDSPDFQWAFSFDGSRFYSRFNGV